MKDEIIRHKRKLALGALVAYAVLALPMAVHQLYGASLHWWLFPGLTGLFPIPLPVIY